MSDHHQITSKAQLRQILSAVKLGSMSVDAAFEKIDLTMRLQRGAVGDWLQKMADDLRKDCAP